MKFKLPRRKYIYLISYILYEPYQHRFCCYVRTCNQKIETVKEIQQIEIETIDQIKLERTDIDVKAVIILNIALLSSKWVWE